MSGRLQSCPECRKPQNSERPHANHGWCRLCDSLVPTDDHGRAHGHMERRCMGVVHCAGSGRGTRHYTPKEQT